MLTSQVSSAEDQRLVVSLAGEKQLDVYVIDDHGSLLIQSQTPMDGQPGASRFDHTGRYLYVAAANPDAICVYRAGIESLELLQAVGVPGKPSFLEITPNGQFLLASYFKTGQVTVHRILGEGRLSDEPLQTLKILPNAHGICIDRNGKYVFVPHTSSDAISQFRMNPNTGQLSPNEQPLLQREKNTGPRHLGFHPDLEFAYGSNESGRSLSQYSFDSKTGLLHPLQTVSSFADGHERTGSTSHLEVHPSGKFAYIANRVEGTIAVFSIDPSTGNLSLVQRAQADRLVRSFSLSPDGRFLVAAGQGSGALASYTIATDGTLKQVTRIKVGKRPWWVTFFPDKFGNQPVVGRTKDASKDRSLTLGQGTMAGEVSDTSALLQTRLTSGDELDDRGDIPGQEAVAWFEWSTHEDFTDARKTPQLAADMAHDFIVRAKVEGLQPDTQYFYRTVYGVSDSNVRNGATCSFRTLPGADKSREVNFIVGSCMNYIKFMHGRAGNAHGPCTATSIDKRLGFPAFEVMQKLQPEFFVGTGDIVYYDNPFRVAKTTEELRRCWHEQFRFPRMIEFFRTVPAYWSKDDHDFRYNDSDNETERLPLPDTGINLFHEQLPLATTDDAKSYRTIRVSRDLQIWLTEGRDYRSPNKSPDGPQKSMWGEVQREWIKSTLAASDAKWKLFISPTPMVGPDDGYKNDNHANLEGFRHEADAFFEWVEKEKIENLFLVCGDRHWQYHSIHPSGIHEFSCGALNDENSRMGVPPGAEFGTDPEGKVRQPYTSPEPSGGFVQVDAGNSLRLVFYNDEGRSLYEFQCPDSTVDNN